MDYGKDFNKFALSSGLSSMNLHYYQKQLENSMTPYILEEREMRNRLEMAETMVVNNNELNNVVENNYDFIIVD